MKWLRRWKRKRQWDEILKARIENDWRNASPLHKRIILDSHERWLNEQKDDDDDHPHIAFA